MRPSDHLEFWQHMAAMQEYRAAHQREHLLQDEAMRLARDGMLTRLNEMNQMRQQITEERGSLISADKLDARLAPVILRLAALEKARDNLDGRMAAWAGGLTLLVIVIQIGLQFVLRGTR